MLRYTWSVIPGDTWSNVWYGWRRGKRLEWISSLQRHVCAFYRLKPLIEGVIFSWPGDFHTAGCWQWLDSLRMWNTWNGSHLEIHRAKLTHQFITRWCSRLRWCKCFWWTMVNPSLASPDQERNCSHLQRCWIPTADPKDRPTNEVERASLSIASEYPYFGKWESIMSRSKGSCTSKACLWLCK